MELPSALLWNPMLNPNLSFCNTLFLTIFFYQILVHYQILVQSEIISSFAPNTFKIHSVININFNDFLK